MDSLTIKYRPQNWCHVIGQDHVVSALINSCKTGNLASAYLFIGTMGTGKTTTARLLAKTLNCSNLQEGNEPCNECVSCRSIMDGNSLDVKELDMATNRGIDDVRVLQEFAQYSSVGGKYRVFICDEAHQLTSQAASALLKILEEPPKNVIFILCTTELQKILGTIRSRCQVYAFKRVNDEEIVNRLVAICEAENVVMEQGVALLIAKHSEGSVRNAESRLSNLIVGGNITLEAYNQMFGSSSNESFASFLSLIRDKDSVNIIVKFKEMIEEITDPSKWASDFAKYLFEELLKDEKNKEVYTAFLDVVEDYLVHLYINQPITFLELMLFRLSRLNIEFKGSSVELQKHIENENDIWALARWMNATEIKEIKKDIWQLYSDGVWVCVGGTDLPYIKIEDISKILELPKIIDKSLLVDKNLVVVE